MTKPATVIGISLCMAISFMLLPANVNSAAQPTPLPTIPTTSLPPSPSPDLTGNTDIRNAIRQEVQRQAGSASTPLATKSAALVGMISNVSGDKKSLTITTARMGDKFVSVATGAAVFRVDSQDQRKSVDYTNTAVGDSIIAIGTPTESDHLSARRIILFTTPVVKPQVTIGQIVSVDQEHLVILSLISRQNSTYLIAKQIKIIRLLKDGRKVTLKLTDLSVGTTVIVASSGLPNQSPSTVLISPLNIPVPSPTVPSAGKN